MKLGCDGGERKSSEGREFHRRGIRLKYELLLDRGCLSLRFELLNLREYGEF